MAILTEADWLACVEPSQLVNFARGRVNEDRFRWLLIQWSKTMLHCMSDHERTYVEAYTRWMASQCVGASPTIPQSDFDFSIRRETPGYCLDHAFGAWERGLVILALADVAEAKWLDFPDPETLPLDASKEHRKKSKKGREQANASRRNARERWERERVAHRERTLWQFANEFRDVAGNPFRPVVFDSRWPTPDVVGLATAIDADGGYERLPILADALEEAGCTEVQLLDHARRPGIHVRGCWLIDMVLNRFDPPPQPFIE